MDREKISFSSELILVSLSHWILVLFPPHPNRAGNFHGTRLSRSELIFFSFPRWRGQPYTQVFR